MADEKIIIEALARTTEIKIAVIGDFCLDKYLYIDPANDEPSVETGLIAYQVDRKATAAGVGGTITNNLRSLGVQTICIGLVGNDGEGFELMQALERVGADASHMVKADNMCTCTYTKPMRKNADGSYTEMNRLDFRNFTPPTEDLEDAMIAELKSVLDDVDGVIVTDQFFQRNAAAVTDGLRKKLCALAKERSDKRFFVDSRAFIYEYSNMIVKCNQYELIKYFAGGVGDPEDMDTVRAEGAKLREKTGLPLFITCGAKGMFVFDENGTTMVDAFKVEGEIDICGAGDATNAGLMTGMSLGLTYAQAARLACAVSSITIRQIGKTGTSTVEQVTDCLEGRPVIIEQ